MIKYYIFGASKMGETALNLLGDKYTIVGFLDNDEKKHNKKFCGKNVYNPSEILISKPHIIIASQYYKEIEEQLISSDIKFYKIFKLTLQDVFIDFESKQYWEERYRSGGNSGSGSYDHLAEFKAKAINQFVEINDIKTVCEWGVGDGNQLALMNYINYTGYDVSKTAIEMCHKNFQNELTKTFILYDGKKISFKETSKSDLALSLDVIYHLVEDEVYETYMSNLFESSNKYVCIYSTNYNSHHVPHVKDREFLTNVNKSNWKLIKYIENEYLPDKVMNKELETSNSNFYFFEKMR